MPVFYNSILFPNLAILDCVVRHFIMVIANILLASSLIAVLFFLKNKKKSLKNSIFVFKIELSNRQAEKQLCIKEERLTVVF